MLSVRPVSALARTIVATIIVLSTVAASPAAPAPDFPKPTGRVNDFAGVLDESAERELVTLLESLERETTAEVAVATVVSLDGMSVEEYANKLFRAWGVGKKGKDNGVLVLVAPTERQMRIEVGYGLEGLLPDGLVGSIIREEFIPAFRNGNYQAGILSGVRRVAGIVRRNERLVAEAEGTSTAQPVDVVPRWVSILFLGLFVSLGAFIAGIGLGAKLALWVLVGMAASGLMFALTWVIAAFPSLAQLPFAAAAMWFGIRMTRSSEFLASVRGRQKTSGWVMSDSSTGSGSSGGSGGSFGGGGSGGGGASGRW